MATTVAFLMLSSVCLHSQAYQPKSATQGIFIKNRPQLPYFSANATGTIKLREVSVGYGAEVDQTVTGFYDVYHSGIQFEVNDNGQDMIFIMEMWDNIGGNSSLVPTAYTEDGAPIWGTDHIVIVSTPGLDEKHWGAWFQSTNGALLASSVSGTHLNALMDFVVSWISNPFNRLYKPYTVWPSKLPSREEKRLWSTDLTCDTFTQDFYFHMAELNIKLNVDIPVLKRNYGPMISKSKPDLIDSTDARLKQFYWKLGQLGSTTAAYAALETWEGPFFVPAPVGDPAAYPSKYYHVAKVEGIVRPSNLLTVTVYSEMPLPQRLLDTCNKVTGTCGRLTNADWTCNLPGPFGGGGTCIEGQCRCEDCVFADDNCAKAKIVTCDEATPKWQILGQLPGQQLPNSRIPLCDGDKPINKGNTARCSGNPDSCDQSTCCEAEVEATFEAKSGSHSDDEKSGKFSHRNTEVNITRKGGQIKIYQADVGGEGQDPDVKITWETLQELEVVNGQFTSGKKSRDLKADNFAFARKRLYGRDFGPYAPQWKSLAGGLVSEGANGWMLSCSSDVLSVDTYIVHNNGAINNRTVAPGDVKFNIEVDGWNGWNMLHRENYLDVIVKIKGKNSVAIKKAGGNSAEGYLEYELGGGISLFLPKLVSIDGSLKEMPQGYPKSEIKADGSVFTFRFPYFNDRAVYEPIVGTGRAWAEAMVANSALGLHRISIYSSIFAAVLAYILY